MMSTKTVPKQIRNLVVISAAALFISLLSGSQARAELIGPPLPQPVYVSTSGPVMWKYFMQGEVDPSHGFSYVAPTGGTISMFRLQIRVIDYSYYQFEFLILRPLGTSNQFTTVQQLKGKENSTYDRATAISESSFSPVRVEAGDYIAIANKGEEGKGVGYLRESLVAGTARDKIIVASVAHSPFQFDPWEGGPNAYIAMNAEFTPDDTTAPKLSGFKLRPKKFRAGGKGNSATAAKKRKKKKAKKGSKISLTSSEDATATITFKRKIKGYKKGKKCKKSKKRKKKSKKRKKRKKCTILKNVGTITTAVVAGNNKIAFSGKAKKKKLKKGLYQATATATDGAGNTSKEVKANFRIVKR